ncbi:MAG: cytidylyltransferase domain-containing protein [Bacteroidales bacterium]
MRGIIIQARTGSTRLANKIVLDFYEGETILSILIKRIKRDNPETLIIVATTINPSDDIIETIATGSGVECFRGSEEDVLSRFISAADKFGIQTIVRVCSDNPFLQTESISTLFSQYDSDPADYISWGFPSGLPVIKSHLGLYTELTTINSLKRVAELTQDNLYHEHVTNYLYANPQEFKINLLELPKWLEHRFDLRFTLDTHEDFYLLQQLYVQWISIGQGSIESIIDTIDADFKIKEQMKKSITENSK